MIRFEQGRAAALGALCRLFCHHDSTGKEISSDHLSKFYRCLTAVGLP